MKDKSRFLSSVIVSLLAGFIYLLAGENSPVNIQSSVRAVLSSNGPDMYLTAECFPFNEISKKSDPKITRNNSKFYLKRSGTDNKQYTEFSSGVQASFVRPLPDKNIDFTTELNKLINNGDESCTQKYLDKNSITGNDKTLSCNEFQIADAERNFKRTDKINKQNIEFNLKYDEGNGFKYNVLAEDISETEHTSECNVFTITSNEESISDINVIVNSKNINKNVNVNRNSNDDHGCTENNVNVNTRKTVTWNYSTDHNEDYYEDYDEDHDEDHDDCDNDRRNDSEYDSDIPGVLDPF